MRGDEHRTGAHLKPHRGENPSTDLLCEGEHRGMPVVVTIEGHDDGEELSVRVSLLEPPPPGGETGRWRHKDYPVALHVKHFLSLYDDSL